MKKGETLWRIARTYGVELEELATKNRLPDATRIEIGQRIFIPGAKELLSVPPLAAASSAGSAETGFVWPVKGQVISYFGSGTGGSVAKGIGIRAVEGEKVLAAADGKVIYLNEGLGAWGKTIILEHPGDLITVYAHNSRLLAAVDQQVRRGEAVALAGSTGRANGPQLYFEIRRRDRPQNPLYFLAQ